MNKSTNYGMNLPQGNNVVDIDVLNANIINNIDKGLSPFYVAVVNSSNTYKVTTGINKTTLANGYSIRVAIPSASNGAVSIIIDTCNAVPVKKPNGNAVTNFKQNGVYSLTYYNSVFILASGGVDDVNFSASDLLENKSANNSDGEKVNGTMKNIGQQTATINAGGKVIITKGYHDGTGYVQSNSMGKQLTDLGVTLTSANQLVKGVKAVDKTGKLIAGTATIQSLGGFLVKFGSFTTGTRVNLGFYPKFVYIIHGGNSGANWSNTEMNIADDFSGRNKELYVKSGGNGNGQILSGGGTLTRDTTGFTFTGNFTDYNYLAIG